MYKMKNNYNNFFKTSDNEQIFYTTNFPPGTVSKDVLVFNYGLVCSNYHWGSQIEFFDRLGYYILLHDYRGHYSSSGADDIAKISLTQITEDMDELFSFLELESMILLGHSLGVNICLEYAKTHQEKIKQMILISGTIIPIYNIMMDTHLTGVLEPVFQSLITNFSKPFRLFWKYGGWSPLFRKGIGEGGFNMNQVSDEFIETYLNKLSQLGPELFIQLLNQMHRHDILAFIDQIKIPSLIIGGNIDKVIPNFNQKLLHSKLEDSELYTVHAGSHVPQVDFINATNERIKIFLESTQPT